MKVLALTLGLLICGYAFAARGADSTVIPEMAKIAGVRVGRDTMEELERRYGPAFVHVGGHPRGGRTWQSKQTGWGLDADGFYYNSRGGRVIDGLSVFAISSEMGSLPEANIPRRSLLFMHAVSIGMSREEVLRRLRDKLPAPESREESLIWKTKGNYRFNRNHYQITDWTARLRFDQDRLKSIDLMADYAN